MSPGNTTSCIFVQVRPGAPGELDQPQARFPREFGHSAFRRPSRPSRPRVSEFRKKARLKTEKTFFRIWAKEVPPTLDDKDNQDQPPEFAEKTAENVRLRCFRALDGLGQLGPTLR